MQNKLKQRAIIFKSYLDMLYPNPACELNYNTHFELMVAVVLSAQCTDIRVNKITKELFKTHNTAKHFANISQKELEQKIFSAGFYTQKAKSIIAASKDILEKFDGRVPNTREELVTLRGVGRKTANVILSEAYKKPAIAVDTHVFRVARRLGLSKAEDVWGVEQDLMKLYDKKDWGKLHFQMVLYGRYHCKARGKTDWEEKFLEYEKNYLTKNKM